MKKRIEEKDTVIGEDAPTEMHHVDQATIEIAQRDPLRPFIAAATTLLGGVIGVLVALPVSTSDFVRSKPFLGSLPGWIFFAIFVALGMGSGYRRRHSRPFFYFSLLTVLVLASLLSGAVREAIRE